MPTTAPTEYASLKGASSSVDVDGPRRTELRFGQRISGLVVNGRALFAPVYNENEVRAAAGLTMVIGAVAFSYAYFDHLFLPLKIVTSFFFIEFLIRVTIGFQYSPIRVVSRGITRGQPPDWVSAKPKRFAWTLGLGMAAAMTVITNVNIHGYLPRTMCLVCLTLMWMESVLGLCLGCKIYSLMVRRGWRGRDADIEVCAGGVCDLPSYSARNPSTGSAGHER
jgi:hypothetical protein